MKMNEAGKNATVRAGIAVKVPHGKDMSTAMVHAVATGPEETTFSNRDAARRPSKAWFVRELRRQWEGKTVRAIAGLLVALVVWEIAARLSGPVVLPTPFEVAKALVGISANGQLPTALLVSLEDLGAGLGISVVAGIGLGLLLGRYRVLSEMFDPIVNLFNATPMVAILPLVIIWLGLGFDTRIVYIVLLSIWSILINTSEGMANMPKEFGELGKVLGLSERQIVWEIGVPSAMPYLVSGLRVAIGRAVIGMVIAEMQVNEVGTGGLAQTYGGAFEPARLLAVVLVLSVIGWALVSGLRGFTRWRYPWMAEIASSKR